MMSQPRRLEFGMFLVLMAGAVNKVREVSAGAGARLHPDYCLSSAWLLFWGVAQKLLVVVSHLQRLMVTDAFVF
jgi:hypothetical protein